MPHDPPLATSMLSATDFRDALRRIDHAVHHTPVVGSSSLSDRIGVCTVLKCENLQKTGAFKVRGALNYLLRMTPEARAAGVVTISAGNHAQALAWAAGQVGCRATVVMPEGASAAKVEASRGYGARVIVHGSVHEAFARAHALAGEEGLHFVHPFDHEWTIAGQGTVGLELLDQVDGPLTVVVPVGGGGLIAGVAGACRALARDVRVFGVEPEGAAAMRASLDRGEAVRLERVHSVADGLAAPMAGALTFEYVRRLVADVVTVSDADIVAALAFLLTRTKLLVEPAGAAAVAALLAGRIPIRRGDTVVAILSGGNVDPALLGRLLAESS